jgi:HSP20 family molecular chaperone IbpA
MWADAITRLARADRLHRDFFRPAPAGWEPPVDLLETATDLIIIAALPGVGADDVELVLRGNEIAIVGTRRLPAVPRPARIHRMELPHGRFERRVALPPGQYELTRRDLLDGCLTVNLRKLT